MSRSLDLAAAEAATCVRCRLAERRTTVVYGSGRHDADLLFVGEGPGQHEDLQGLPFVGAAGQLLERMLGGIGLSRDEVYIANVVKCRPPGNRDPRPDEIEACSPWLEEQIGLIDPATIVTLGNFATRFVLREEVSISRVRGQRFAVGGRTVIPTYHPAAILRSGGEGSSRFREFAADFAVIATALSEPRHAPAVTTAPATAPPEATGPSQLGLFA